MTIRRGSFGCPVEQQRDLHDGLCVGKTRIKRFLRAAVSVSGRMSSGRNLETGHGVGVHRSVLTFHIPSALILIAHISLIHSPRFLLSSSRHPSTLADITPISSLYYLTRHCNNGLGSYQECPAIAKVPRRVEGPPRAHVHQRRLSLQVRHPHRHRRRRKQVLREPQGLSLWAAPMGRARRYPQL